MQLYVRCCCCCGVTVSSGLAYCLLVCVTLPICLSLFFFVFVCPSVFVYVCSCLPLLVLLLFLILFVLSPRNFLLWYLSIQPRLRPVPESTWVPIVGLSQPFYSFAFTDVNPLWLHWIGSDNSINRGGYSGSIVRSTALLAVFYTHLLSFKIIVILMVSMVLMVKTWNMSHNLSFMH